MTRDPTFGSRTSVEVAGGRWIVVVPVGSVEQHGPHLPLDTDTRIAVAVAEGAARGMDRVAVAPAVAYGASGEHAGLPGTLSIGLEVLEAVVVELCRSAGPEVRAICFVNGHGGNTAGLRRALETVASEGRRAVGWWPAVPPGGDLHAGRTETSVLLALAPELVRLDRAAPGATEPLHVLWARMRAGGVRSVSANGVLGDPTGASAAEGRVTLAAWIDDLHETLHGLCGDD